MTDAIPAERGAPTVGDIEELERSIASLPDVKAVRVVATPSGRVTEVHLIAESNKSPKQLVRDVETLAHAHFGIEIDRRVVSIVQFGGEVTATAQPPELASIAWSTEGMRATCRVRIQTGDESHIGEAAGAATSSARMRLAATATTQALSALRDVQPLVDVREMTFLDFGEHRVAVVLLVLLTPDGQESPSVGSSLVRSDDSEALVRAILDAVH